MVLENFVLEFLYDLSERSEKEGNPRIYWNEYFKADAQEKKKWPDYFKEDVYRRMYVNNNGERKNLNWLGLNNKMEKFKNNKIIH